MSDLIIINGSQDSRGYCATIQVPMLEFVGTTLEEIYTFQQDKSDVHTLKYTRKWFLDRGIDFMHWPAKSPDLNMIENVQRILSKALYKNGHQFDKVDDFISYVEENWGKYRLSTYRRFISPSLSALCKP